MAARRSAIMTSAREMLAEKNVADISLRELSDRVGLAKSNVLRYFDSREAIFLEVLDEEFQAWLADLEARLGRPRARKADYANEIRVATAVADSLVDTAIAVRAARVDGRGAGAQHLASTSHATSRPARWGESPSWRNSSRGNCRGCPASSPSSSQRARSRLTAGMYPFSVPTEPVRAAIAELGFPDPGERFGDGLRVGLVTWLIGAAAQTEA